MVVNVKYKDSKIGPIPTDWEALPLNKLGIFLRGKGISKKELKDTGIPCLTYGEIYTTDKYYRYKFNNYIDEYSAKESQEIQKGDILFAGSGETLDEIGKSIAYLDDEKAYAGGDVLILRNEKANSHFLSFVLNSDIFFKQSRSIGQGHSVVHIYPSGLKKIMVTHPSLFEQSKIATVLYNLDIEIETLSYKKNIIKETKKGLMQQLLTGKTRVKIEET